MITPTIKFRVFLLAVLPTTAVSIFFFSYFASKQIDDIEDNIFNKGKSLATHLASASEYGVFSGNLTILTPLVESAFKKSDVISITITNNQGTPLIQKNKTLTFNSPNKTLNSARNRIFSQPVIQHTIDINDFEVIDDDMPPVIGWVVIEVSNDALIKSKREAIFQTLTVTLFILIGSIFLATRVSRHITEPITSLTNAVNKIADGNLDISIETHSSGALLTLEKGIRSMLQSIKSSHWEAQQKIDQATQELRESLELLEHQNSELTKTRQQALSANQAKSSFLANISHEIRTPMNGILGFVKLLKNSNPTQEQDDYLYTIEQSANNLLRIINDVLDFSKIEAGKISINNVHFNLEECVEDVLSLISPSAHEKNIEIASLFYDDTPTELIGAADRVRQILINLIGNAIKFSETGTIMVRVMLESRSNEALRIKITITDQGTGISEKDKKLLFNSFSQVDESDTRQYGGAGLGLAISKSLAEAMHGDIGVESRKHEGSIFWFTFECQSNNSPEFLEGPQHYCKKSIRLYDANELTRLSMAHAFRHFGFDVTECLEIPDLYAPLKVSKVPDMYVLSLNSIEATSTAIHDFLSHNKNNSSFKIFTVVSDSKPITLTTLRNWGADVCISKPFRRIEFKKALASIFPKEFNDPTQIGNTLINIEKQTRLDGLSILIAEDNAINAKLVETILLRSGATPNVVTNGEKAVDAFNNGGIDLILMDIHMPEMNGVDAARIIRESEGGSVRTPIIGLTAILQNKNDMLSRNPDFDDILEKPIAADELLHEISYWAHIKKTSADSRPPTFKRSQNLGIDKRLSSTLNEMLLNELPSVKINLQAAFNSNDYRYLRGEIHRLLGGMAYCNFAELQKLTLQYQVSLKAEHQNMAEDFQKMTTEMGRLIENSNPKPE